MSAPKEGQAVRDWLKECLERDPERHEVLKAVRELKGRGWTLTTKWNKARRRYESVAAISPRRGPSLAQALRLAADAVEALEAGAIGLLLSAPKAEEAAAVLERAALGKGAMEEEEGQCQGKQD